MKVKSREKMYLNKIFRSLSRIKVFGLAEQYPKIFKFHQTQLFQ